MSICSSVAKLPRNMSSGYLSEGHPLPFMMFLTAALLSTILMGRQEGEVLRQLRRALAYPPPPVTNRNPLPCWLAALYPQTSPSSIGQEELQQPSKPRRCCMLVKERERAGILVILTLLLVTSRTLQTDWTITIDVNAACYSQTIPEECVIICNDQPVCITELLRTVKHLHNGHSLLTMSLTDRWWKQQQL